MVAANQNDPPRSDPAAAARLEKARNAAEEFCRKFAFAERYIEKLKNEPIQKPLLLDRDGRRVEVFRWLGHGRGAPIVQVEVGLDDHVVTVFGGPGDRELGPWSPS